MCGHDFELCAFGHLCVGCMRTSRIVRQEPYLWRADACSFREVFQNLSFGTKIAHLPWPGECMCSTLLAIAIKFIAQDGDLRGLGEIWAANASQGTTERAES